MYTIISGTNRAGSLTLKVAKLYQKLLQSKGIEAELFNLQDMTGEMLNGAMYDQISPAYKALQDKYLVPAEKLIFIVPEYNGAFPGVLKLMIDASEVKKAFHFKKAALVGVADGRAGNARGLDTLTNMFNYMNMPVLPLKIPISKINTEITAEGEFANESTYTALNKQADLFLAF